MKVSRRGTDIGCVGSSGWPLFCSQHLLQIFVFMNDIWQSDVMHGPKVTVNGKKGKGETLEDLNVALDFWVREDYHQRNHSSTGQSPFNRFTSHVELIRTPPPDLETIFVKSDQGSNSVH